LDVRRLAAGEKDFWSELWIAPDLELRREAGFDLVRFGPVRAACLTTHPDRSAVNFALGASEPGAVEHGHLADAIAWLEARCTTWGEQGVDFRVPVTPGLPGSEAAERCLAALWIQPERGPANLVRAATEPGFAPPGGIEVFDWTEWDEGFGDPLAEGLGLPSAGSFLFLSLLGTEDWSCYCAVDGDAPLAYAAMRRRSGVASLAIASRPSEGRDGEGQLAVLHSCIVDARAADCDALVVVDAGEEPPGADRDSLLAAGFEAAYECTSWRSRERVPV
jgi:hypothetical protein